MLASSNKYVYSHPPLVMSGIILCSSNGFIISKHAQHCMHHCITETNVLVRSLTVMSKWHQFVRSLFSSWQGLPMVTGYRILTPHIFFYLQPFVQGDTPGDDAKVITSYHYVTHGSYASFLSGTLFYSSFSHKHSTRLWSFSLYQLDLIVLFLQ